MSTGTDQSTSKLSVKIDFRLVEINFKNYKNYGTNVNRCQSVNTCGSHLDKRIKNKNGYECQSVSIYNITSGGSQLGYKTNVIKIKNRLPC